jgi:hypothetical protein
MRAFRDHAPVDGAAIRFETNPLELEPSGLFPDLVPAIQHVAARIEYAERRTPAIVQEQQEQHW